MIRGCKNQKRRMFMKEFKCGLRDGIPIAVGYFAVSFGFGVVAFQDGIPAWLSVLMSLTNVTSAGQFAGLEIIAAASGVMLATVLEMILTQFIINLRYALMGLSLSQKLGPTMNTARRMFFAFSNTDEIFAVAASQPEKLYHHYLYGLMTMPYIGWSLGTFLGAAAGQILPEFVCNALGIAIYGMFLAIILPPARREKPVRVVVLIAVAVSLLFHYLPMLKAVSGGFAVIICAVVAAALGALLFPVKDASVPADREVQA